MNYTELSDLEEGEILECDIVLSSDSRRKNLGPGSGCFEFVLKSGLKEHSALNRPQERSDGYSNRRLKEKINVNDRMEDDKSPADLADLESISSEGEYKSDEDENYSVDENQYYKCSKGARREGMRHSSQFYGTVEDIMSEIGETICRKSRCNYKRRKSKEPLQKHDKSSENSYDLWHHKIFSGHQRSKKQKRNSNLYNSSSNFAKEKTERRKRRKHRVHKEDKEEEEEEEEGEEEETASKKQKLIDFDEMRRNLLEKLKKQKAEEELKPSANDSPSEGGNSEIQMVDMLLDCTNYVDNPLQTAPGKLASEEKEGEDESDLVELRLLALASNKRRKEGEGVVGADKAEDVFPQETSKICRDEVDSDRNELLLRAEALKTALLKKHQRRLNRIKVEKLERSRASDEGTTVPPPANESADNVNLEKNGDNLDAEAGKENRTRINDAGVAGCPEVPSEGGFHPGTEENQPSKTAPASNINSKKNCSKMKSKRRRKKPVSSENSLKENEKSEALEEDDRMLRTQLLSDLMKKKSLKDLEKKTVLTDSCQTVANKPSLPATRGDHPEESIKPLSTVKKNSLKKINATNAKPKLASAFPKAEIQRIIVHLGSEDSSDEDVAPQNRTSPQGKGDEDEGAAAAGSPDGDQGRSSKEVIQANYEKSVELLLSQARKKVEGKKHTATSSFATPEAVYKHLPPSQRLEYIRLKQKIAERESQRNRKKENAGNSVVTASGSQSPDVSVAKRKESAESVNQKPKAGNLPKDCSAPARIDPKIGPGFVGTREMKATETNPIAVSNKIKRNASEFSKKNSNSHSVSRGNAAKLEPSASLLLPSSQALISKLKLLLRKIKIEKTIEENYEKEMSKLKNQLSLFEKRKHEQRFKIKKLWEESMKTYRAVQGITGTLKGKRDEKDESTDGGKKPETEEKNQEEGKKVSDEPETDTRKAQSKCDKETNADEKDGEPPASGTPRPRPLKYDSPLEALRNVSGHSKRVDPNVTVCQFDLMGVCKDEECSFQHLRILAK